MCLPLSVCVMTDRVIFYATHTQTPDTLTLVQKAALKDDLSWTCLGDCLAR